MRQPGSLQPTSASAEHECWGQTPPFIPLLSPNPAAPPELLPEGEDETRRALRPRQVAAVPASATRGQGRRRQPPAVLPATCAAPWVLAPRRRPLQTQALSATAVTATPRHQRREPECGVGGVRGGTMRAGLRRDLRRARTCAAGGALRAGQRAVCGGETRASRALTFGPASTLQGQSLLPRRDLTSPPLPRCVSPGRCLSEPVSSSEQ